MATDELPLQGRFIAPTSCDVHTRRTIRGLMGEVAQSGFSDDVRTLSMVQARPLWIHVESDEFSVSTPRRFRSLIATIPADRLIRIDPELLMEGVFFGSGRACTVRLEEIPRQWPHFAIRYNSRYQCRLMGFGCDVAYNERFLGCDTYTLFIDDAVTCEPYRLRIVPRPESLLQDLVERLTPHSNSDDEEGDERDFRLSRPY